MIDELIIFNERTIGKQLRIYKTPNPIDISPGVILNKHGIHCSTIDRPPKEPISKGTYSLSGSINYYQYEPEGASTSREINIGPKFFYFISDNISVGGVVGYYRRWTDGGKTNGYGIGPLVRYYFHGTNIYPFISLQYMYGKYKTSCDSYVDSEDTYKSTSFGVGFNYFMSHDISLETEFAYISQNSRSSSTVSGSSFESDHDSNSLTINIGINVFFNYIQ